NLVDKDFVDLIHDMVRGLRSQDLHERGESDHIAKHHGDLFPLPFDSIPLGEDFLCYALGQVFQDLFQLLLKREFFRGYGREGQVVAAFATEFELSGISEIAFRADPF
ncbi:MAG: hypothetical protein MUC98_16900, partial [Desulfobacterota bacterium]|nr:hypothetical protein [Thermodesulfobacteriota bacterium]